MRSGSRRLLVGVLTLVLPNFGSVGAIAVAPAFAQQAAPAEEAEAPSKRRRGRERPAARTPVTAPGMQQAKPVEIFGDWNVFAMGQGKTRVCYAIAQPQTRSPKTLKRDTAYLFVTVRKGENVQNEVAVMLGFPPKPSAAQGKPGASASPAPTDPTLNLGNARYGLVVKETNAWLQNPAEESRVVTEMGRTSRLTIKTTSMRGNPTVDEYALAGFAEAMKRTREECNK